MLSLLNKFENESNLALIAIDLKHIELFSTIFNLYQIISLHKIWIFYLILEKHSDMYLLY